MADQIEENLRCPTCLEIFKDPVMLPCSHSVCRACAQQRWEQNEDRTCPVCRTACITADPPPNLALRNMGEIFSKFSVGSEGVCSLHGEKLKLFCLNHQELVCLVCKDAKIHTGHKFSPLDEVTEDHKGKLQHCLQGPKKRLEDYNETIDNFNDQAMHIKFQRERLESQIMQYFAELHSFLQVEEEARLAAVRREEQEKTRLLKEKIEVLSRDVAGLSDAIRSTEDRLTSDQVSTMKKLQSAKAGIPTLQFKPELLSEVLLDERRHVGNLKSSVLDRMKAMFSDGPVTSGPKLSSTSLLADDQCSSSDGEESLKKNDDIDALTGDVMRSIMQLPSEDSISFSENLQTVIFRLTGELLLERIRNRAKDAGDRKKEAGSHSSDDSDSNTTDPKPNRRAKIARVFKKVPNIPNRKIFTAMLLHRPKSK